VSDIEGVRTFDVHDWTVDRVMAAKGGRRVSLCIPCRDEVATIGPLVRMIRSTLMDRVAVVDELIVLDDRSTDDSAEVAAQAGAEVVDITKIHETHGVGHGKGNALWATLLASSGDIIVWCDGDVTSVAPSWITSLLAPLLDDPTVALAKALYHRPTSMGGGGRTTELVARPLLSLYIPELARLEQPLSGEFAGRRDALESIPFVEGWGVEIAMLIDLARNFGAHSIAQVDLGERHHRHRSLHELSVQAAEVMATFLDRLTDCPPFNAEGRLVLTRADGSEVPLNLAERPPVDGLRRDPPAR
jgi:glucosyl-3-phosphoglycerate synthase